MAALVPYREFDPAHARFAVDERALVTTLAALPHYCRDHEAVCLKAEALAAAIGSAGLALTKDAVVELKAHSAAIATSS